MERLFNCIEAQTGFPVGLFRRSFVYVDGAAVRSRHILRRHGVRSMKVLTAFRDGEHPEYVIIVCRVGRREAGRFSAAMEALQRAMPVFGCMDYRAFCALTFARLGDLLPSGVPGD